MYGSVSGCVLAPYPLSAVSTAPPAPKWLGLLERKKIFHFFDSKEEVVTAMGMAARGEGKNAAVVVKRSSGG